MACVLVATDDAGLALILLAEIESMGFEGVWEIDGYAAHAAALEQSPFVAMLDANLSIHTGMELAAMLRADPDVPRELPIWLMTDDVVEPHALERAGVTRVFPKNHDAAMLREWLMDAFQATPQQG